MKTQNKAARVETAYGQTLATPISFTYTYEELEKLDSIPANEMPDADDLRSFVNQKRNAAARSKAQNEALTAAGIQKPTLEDPTTRLATMVKVLIAAGNTQEQAEQIAKSVLNVE